MAVIFMARMIGAPRLAWLLVLCLVYSPAKEPTPWTDTSDSPSSPRPPPMTGSTAAPGETASSLEGPVGIRNVRVPGRGTTTLMRVMQTNACSLSCGYCPTFCGGQVKRTALGAGGSRAHLHGGAPRRRWPAGSSSPRACRAGPSAPWTACWTPCTSSGGARASRAMSIVKMLPGAQADQVREATRLCDRVSINLEGPRRRRGAAAREGKGPRRRSPARARAGRAPVARRAARGPARSPGRMGTTTQFVVGAQGEQDREILGLVGRLEGQGLLHHAHFSAFQPVAGTPMEGLAAHAGGARVPPLPGRAPAAAVPLSLRRAAVFGADGNLSLELDPKTAWALAHPAEFPVDVARASSRTAPRARASAPGAAARIVAERRRVAFRGAGGSAPARRGHPPRGLLPHAGRPAARARAAAAAAPALRRRRPSALGGLAYPHTPVRLSLRPLPAPARSA